MRPERCCYDGDKVNYGDQDNSTMIENKAFFFLSHFLIFLTGYENQ